MRKFCVSKPFCRMYKTEDMQSEISDEVLFGTFLEVIFENDSHAYCETDYGYRGFVSRWDIEECSLYRRCKENRQILYKRCDFLAEADFSSSVRISLPAGARITGFVEYDERFCSAHIGGKKLYFHKAALKMPEGDVRNRVCENALSYVGTPYRWGGKTHAGVDCSGLVFMSYFLCGIDSWRDSDFCESKVIEISHSEVLPGDTVYFSGHIALMLSKDTFIHASASKGYVVAEKFGESLSYSDVLCFGRSKNI